MFQSIFWKYILTMLSKYKDWPFVMDTLRFKVTVLAKFIFTLIVCLPIIILLGIDIR